ncbi:MAG TPA: carboxypeptidase regulatory-like domain-containing protein, partial [Vicinamibacterales bacterium]
IIGAMPNTGEFMSERMMADAAAVERAIMSGNVQPPTAPGQPPTVTVQVSPPQTGPIEGPPGFLTTYYPGTLVVGQATAITVAANEERAGVDIQVMPVQSATIQGTVITPLAPGLAVQLSLLSEDPMSASMSPMSTRVGQEGKFTFRNVPPGRYTVMAQTVAAPPQMNFVNGVPSPPQPMQPVRLEDSQRLWGRADVAIEGPTSASVTIALQPGKSISGTVSFDMQSPPDVSRARLTVTLGTAPSIQQFTNFGALPQGQIGADGRFTITGVIPGRYILRAAGGIMKSSIVGGQDTLDFPLDFTGERDITDAVLTVTDRSSELSGVLTDVAGKPAVDYAIVVAPVDPRFWLPGARRVMMTRPDTAGRYAFRSLPPGDYMIAAVTDLDPGGQFDPEFLKAVAGGSVRVSIAEGSRVAQDLRVGR